MSRPRPLRVLILEDRAADAELLLHELQRGGYYPDARIVATEKDYAASLDPGLDIILADFSLPSFDAIRALEILHERGLDVPFIVITGILSDEAAVECIKHGAFDYLLKDRLARLGQAVGHALDERKLGAEKRAAEEETERQRNRLEAIFARSREGFFLFDDGGRLVDINPAGFAQLGVTREQLVGTPVWKLGPPGREEMVRERWQAFIEAGGAEGEQEFPLPDGKVVEIEYSATANVAPGLHLAVIRDVTLKNKAERALLQSQKLESLGVMAAGIAHDFNNLLVAVLGNADLALIELAPESPAREPVEQVKIAAKRAADLARQMLALSGRGLVTVQPIDLNTMVEEMTNVLKASISKTAVLKFNLTPGLPAIMADATQIRQVVMNLVVNASDAIGSRSGVITINTGVVRVDDAFLTGALPAPEMEEGDCVFLEVADTGQGMDAETRARIFDPFFTTKFTGRGLGLAAVLSIVKGHNGAIKVYSEPGHGTTFKACFPALTAGVVPQQGEENGTAGWRGSGTALVADDDESVRRLTARALESMGFRTELARDGREAVESFRRDPDGYALVMLDMTMPHLGGAEAFSEIRRIRPEAVVVLMSGYNEQEATDRLAGKQLSGFIQKPFEIRTLREVVRSAVDSGRMVR